MIAANNNSKSSKCDDFNSVTVFLGGFLISSCIVSPVIMWLKEI